MKKVRMPLGSRSYDIHIGSGASTFSDEILPA